MSEISNKRKAAYYTGICLMIIGVILFISVFFSFIGSTTNSDISGFVIRAISGMILVAVGAIVMIAGKGGLAGSGILLEPDKAVDDLRPFNKAKGKMINDVVENIDILDNMKKSTREIIKIKCKECGALNDEDAKYCKACSKKL